MRERQVVAVAAVAVVSALALWGLFPAGGGGPALAKSDRRIHMVDPLRRSAPNPVVLGKGWRLAFDAGFSGSVLNTSVWATCFPWNDVPTGCRNFGERNEHQWFLPSQDQVYGDALHLVAQPIPTAGFNKAGQPEEYSCRAGMVTTYPSFHFEYGYVQVVARMPSDPGLWSALWLVAANLRWPPEIDIVEHWAATRTGVYYHPVGAAKTGSRPDPPGLFVGWHTFSLLWTPSNLTWYIDGQAVMTVSQHIPHELMYFIADLADSWLPGGCTGTLLIRSVKVWQHHGGTGSPGGA